MEATISKFIGRIFSRRIPEELLASESEPTSTEEISIDTK